ncbi:MAG: ABC transporter ATP-binding protein/permease [Deltaproteobacteria bacterium]|nr:ABC transporter ATP-binding protein/permease [Deltaproteobacteria bacterium]
MNKFLFSILRFFKWKLVALTLAAVAIGATDGAIPFLVKYLFDDVIDNQKIPISIFVSALVGIGLIRASLNFFYVNFSATLGNNAIKILRDQIFNKSLTFSPQQTINLGPSRITSLVVNDSAFLKELVIDLIPGIIKDSIRLLSLTIVSFYLNFNLSLIILFTIPFVALIVQKISKRARKYASLAQTELGTLTSLTINVLLGIKTVLAFNMVKLLREEFNNLTDKIKKFAIKADVSRQLTVPINEALASIGIASAIFYGVNQIQLGVLTKGDFIGFIVTLGLLYDPIKKISKLKSQASACLGAMERVSALIDKFGDETWSKNPSMPTRSIDKVPDHAKSDIVLDNITFSYSEHEVISGLSISIPFGTKVAIIGPSGTGKSTLADIIVGFAKANAGEVYIGGVSVSNIPKSILWQKITYLPQAPVYFELLGVRNFGENPDIHRLESLLEKMSCKYLMERILSSKQVGELAGMLSGGERQRIFIAKCLLKESDIYIFDEAVSSLDYDTERRALDLIFEILRDKTVIFISHRETIRNYVDKIIELDMLRRTT